MTSTQEFSCVFCKESFENKEELQIHFRKHGDPKFNPSSRVKNRSQNETSDEKRNEDEELVNCDVCPEVFPTISKAITHKHKVHPDHDAKYFCPWCGKLFTMKHLYNKHLQTSHPEQAKNDVVNFHCDMCNVDFFIATAMLYHNKFFHRQDTDLSSIGQSKKLRMINQDILQIYYCAFCGDEYDNKVNLHKHVLDDHNDENQSPEDVLRCPLCEAVFYHLDAYELHLTFHSTEDLYTETNELFEQITEFSLETVPPLMEKVEIVEAGDAESAINTIGLEKFLEMAMDNSNDNDKPKKSKKHKKHKKSKKSAITLDEFLNMNKDVFGEGLDFEGIEEVPTKVVAKGLKQKKVGRPSLKRLESTNIEKLKKQGIIVKMNSKKLPIKAVKSANKPSQVQQNTQNKATPQTTTPNEVLSRLSNTEIKIVKKSSNEKTDFDSHSEPPLTGVEGLKKCQSPEDNGESDVKQNLSGAKEKTEDQTKSFNISNSISRNEPQTEFESSKDTNSAFNTKSPCFETKQIIQKDCKNQQSNDHIEKKKPNILSNNSSVKTSIPAVIKEEIKESATSSAEEPLKTSEKNLNNVMLENTKQLLTSNDNKTKNSLDALKHLSHLITIKSVNSKGSPIPAQTLQNYSDTNDSDFEDTGNISDGNEEEMPDTVNNENETFSSLQPNDEKSTFDSLKALKTLNKNLIVKPLMHSPKSVTEKIKDNVDAPTDDNVAKSTKTQVLNRNTPAKNLVGVNIDNNVKLSKQAPELKQISNIDTNITAKLEKQNANVNLLKHLTNITAKPISKMSKTTISEKSTGSSQLIGKKGITHTELNKKEMNENIEIYNIDDSDSDEAGKSNSIHHEVNTTKIISNEYTSNKSLNKLKHVQNISVKSLNQQTTHIKKNIVKQMPLSQQAQHNSNQFSMSDFSDEDDQDMLMPANLSINQKLSLQSSNIQALKNLGKNITVKSRNSSPGVFVTSNKDFDFESRDEMDDPDSDNESVPGKVKITELNDDNISDNEMNEREIDTHEHEANMFVQSPEGSNCDNDNDFKEDPDDELSDLETHIKANTLKKPLENTQGRTIDIKNMNKNLTIKSINKGKKEFQPSQSKIIPSAISSNKELSIKPFKQTTTEEDNDSVTGKNSKVTKSVQAINQLANQNVASNNQVSTINKEVTVKTFQTKTVIQEITTTVTKTIKTVNQTVKQQSQSSSQIAQPEKYQKVQGMKSNQNLKNFQGVTVRQAAPNYGTKVRGLTPTRPTTGAAVRPSNQLVPVRPSFNPTRATTPRMAAVKKIGPSTSPRQQSPNVTRPIKISPNVVTTKRPSDADIGHFSCFKKPKESLIPVTDVPNFDNEQPNSTVHYTSHSKSNFSSATKVVRGNKVVTASQVKTEMSSSSQLSKLNNLSGLKIVKTSQSKQAVQVEEKNELNASQRNTLEAIEKLQKQGLLIKKPRVDVHNDSDLSDGENNQYLTEEPED